MGKENKKKIRAAFRDAVFKRDNYACVGCGLKVTKDNAEEYLDAHHVTPREEMPFGGYVKENGVSLCKAESGCHEKAEDYYANGHTTPEFTPDALYKKIGSSRELAEKASAELSKFQ